MADFANLYSGLLEGKESLAVVGLGYVGLPMAVAFSKARVKVIGYDVNKTKIDLYRSGIDLTHEVGSDEMKAATVCFTADENALRDARFHIVAVPTPVSPDHTPDLTPLKNAAKMIGRNLNSGSVVVFESTVYPGVTESVCLPILENESGMTCGKDFKIGYSPERISPGDKLHRLENIKKIVSGCDAEAVELIEKVYQLIIKAGIYPVSSIKTAEAIKVAENSQRDVNIAFMNELAMVFDRMGIDTNEVVDGMNTKWNALGFRPGLVGGHCIGVDPYYFTYEAERLGYHSQMVLSGRVVNDGMSAFVADAVIKKLIKVGKAPSKSKVIILGITFKENCPDIRNSKTVDLYHCLQEYGINPLVTDPLASRDEVLKEYGIALSPLDECKEADCLIFAVAHSAYRCMAMEVVVGMYKDISEREKVLIDVKGMFSVKALEESGMTYWRL